VLDDDVGMIVQMGHPRPAGHALVGHRLREGQRPAADTRQEQGSEAS